MQCDSRPSGGNKLESGRKVCPPPAWVHKNQDILDMLRPQAGLPRVALTGGIASGKSAAAEVFCLLGAAHIDFDILARSAVAPGTEGWAALYELLGASYFLPDKSLDRGKTARAIFKKPDIKLAVEAIIHPATWLLMGDELKVLPDKPVLISVPLLFEAGLETFFNQKVLVFTAPDIQLKRLMARDSSLSRRRANRIIESQWPASEKISSVDYVIDNSGSIGRTIKKAAAVWHYIMAPGQ